MFSRRLDSLGQLLGYEPRLSDARSRDLFESTQASTSVVSHEAFYVGTESSQARRLLPCVVIPANFDTDDFFASVATYYPEFSPLSALVHVLDEEAIGIFPVEPNRNKSAGSEFDSPWLRIGFIGAAIGESILTSLRAPDNAGSVLSYSACRRTLAFALSRGLNLHRSSLRPEVLIERWIRLRRMAGLGVVEPAVSALALICDLVRAEGHSSRYSRIDPRLRNVLADSLTKMSGTFSEVQGVLAEMYPAVRGYIPQFDEAFDTRMTAFNKVVDAVRMTALGSSNDEIALAFFCNKILPGSFEHVGILGRTSVDLPGSLIWYGLFSLLTAEVGSKQPFPGICAKLERDLLEPFSFENRPTCDISLDEFEVLSRGPLRSETIKPSQQRAILVSLLPGIDMYSRFGDPEVGQDRLRNERIDDANSRVLRLLEEAAATIRRSLGSNSSASQHGVRRRRDSQ